MPESGKPRWISARKSTGDSPASRGLAASPGPLPVPRASLPWQPAQWFAKTSGPLAAGSNCTKSNPTASLIIVADYTSMPNGTQSRLAPTEQGLGRARDFDAFPGRIVLLA
jgi:hypothetical protein